MRVNDQNPKGGKKNTKKNICFGTSAVPLHKTLKFPLLDKETFNIWKDVLEATCYLKDGCIV